MNELQRTEFEILKAFIEVCNKLDLIYYLVLGSALGAVKYGGFIPWDDDIDVAMPREHYEVFCKNAQELLPKRFFVQTSNTDKEYPHMYCKIRDSHTTYIEKGVTNLNICHGVYIDVFPLDGYPKEEKEQKKLEKTKIRLKLKLFACFDSSEQYSFKSRLLRRAERILGFHKQTQQIVKKLTAEVSRWPINNSNIICNHGNWQGTLEYAYKTQYGKGTMVLFEGLNVRVPEKYDEYLTQKYGNWRADLPKDQQVGHHYYTVCDLKRPYTEYMKTKI